jgi:Predicted transmembrane and coiled-coil 2 protein
VSFEWKILKTFSFIDVITFQTTQKELGDMSLALESERYRAERLEGQINDLTELHQVKLPQN